MQRMFRYANRFDQDISRWNVESVTDFEQFMLGTRLSTDNYNRLLIRWSNLDLNPDLVFTASIARYDKGLPTERRQYIIDNFGWTITDGGQTGDYYKDSPMLILIR